MFVACRGFDVITCGRLAELLRGTFLRPALLELVERFGFFSAIRGQG
jgi:hypothetical protein